MNVFNSDDNLLNNIGCFILIQVFKISHKFKHIFAFYEFCDDVNMCLCLDTLFEEN